MSAPITPAHPAVGAESAAPSAEAAQEEYRFTFHGNTGEYFRIWIVNVTLSILTLGIYSAWAKVRNKRYFYGNTYLAGVNFQYHAKPLSILIARLIVFGGIIVGGGLLAGNDPFLIAVHSLLLAFLLPWAIVRGFAFNARNSSYRGLRFGFHRRYLSLYLNFLPVVLLPVVALNIPAALSGAIEGLDLYNNLTHITTFFAIWAALAVIFAPFLTRNYHRFKAENHFLGDLSFSFNTPLRGYLLTLWLAPVAMAASVLLAYSSLLWTTALPETAEFSPSDFLVAFLVMGALVYVVFFFWWFVITAKTFKLFWNGVSTAHGRVVCDISVWRFAFNIQLLNYMAMILTLGLATPWARVRKVRYLADNMSVIAAPELMDEIAAVAAARADALGETFADAEGFDFDVGLI